VAGPPSQRRPPQNFRRSSYETQEEKMSTPSATTLATTNPELAKHAAAIRALGKRVVADIIEIGRHLKECKRIVGHGHWLAWLEREFQWSDVTAGKYMRVAEMAGKFELSSDLDLPVSGLYLLAKPSTPPEAQAEVIDRAAAGETIGHKEIKKVVAKHKPKSTTATAVTAAANRAEKPILERERRQAAAEQSAEQREELYTAADENGSTKHHRRAAAEISGERFDKLIMKLEAVLGVACDRIRKTREAGFSTPKLQRILPAIRNVIELLEKMEHAAEDVNPDACEVQCDPSRLN
jgi:hypothetical protein